MNFQITQEAFLIIDRLSEFGAREGIDNQTRDIINEQIRRILKSVIDSAVTSVSAKGSGIVAV